MFDDYLKEVLAAYAAKKDEGELSQNLLYPTPGKLRDECLIVYRERSKPQDDPILRLFFKYSDKDKGYTKVIENFNVNEFRQIPKILDGRVTTPGVKYIDLLAWLIDFNPRPSTLYYTTRRNNNHTNNTRNSYTTGPTKDEKNTVDETDSVDAKMLNNGSDEKDELQEHVHTQHIVAQPASNTKKQRLSLAAISTCIVILLTGLGAFLFWYHFTGTTRIPSSDEKCMYWAGDHYEPINCNEKVGNIPIVPLDIKTLKLLKKINSADTLTKDAIGKVWYSSVGGEHEFFTDSGVHPIDTVKRLRPLTSYILTNHVSYYRYQLTVLVWSISIIIIIVIGTVLVNYFRKKRRINRLS